MLKSVQVIPERNIFAESGTVTTQPPKCVTEASGELYTAVVKEETKSSSPQGKLSSNVITVATAPN